MLAKGAPGDKTSYRLVNKGPEWDGEAKQPEIVFCLKLTFMCMKPDVFVNETPALQPYSLMRMCQ